MSQKTYRIMSEYKGNKKKIDTAKGERTAYYLKSEYEMAFGNGWKVWVEDSQGNKLE